MEKNSTLFSGHYASPQSNSRPQLWHAICNILYQYITREETNMRRLISKRLSDAVTARKVTVPELCAALGISAAGMTASALWDAIVDRYAEARGL